jgi:hypothetical protein
MYRGLQIVNQAGGAQTVNERFLFWRNSVNCHSRSTWNKALETGGFLVGDDVDVTLNIERHGLDMHSKVKG